MHPGVGRQDPEGTEERSDGDGASGKKMQARADLLHAEQHDAKKTRLQKKGRQHFAENQRAEGVSRLGRQPRSVEPELVLQDQPRRRAHRHGEGKHFQPIAVDVQEDLLPAPQPKRFKRHQEVVLHTALNRNSGNRLCRPWLSLPTLAGQRTLMKMRQQLQ